MAGRPQRPFLTRLRVTCRVCGKSEVMKNTNEGAAQREAERKGWIQPRYEGEDLGIWCAECFKSATGRDPREEA